MSTLKRTGSTRAWRRLRLYVLERDGWRCQLEWAPGRKCGAIASHVDHVIPRSVGGTDHPGNLRAACAACNLRRGAGPGQTSGQGASQRRPRRRQWTW